MKYKGEQIKAPQSRVIAFPRDEIVGGKVVSNDLVFVIRAVLDFTPFEAVCPEPKPPKKIGQGGKEEGVDLEDKTYGVARELWWTQRVNWMILQSLTTPNPKDLEWETVDPKDPTTWGQFREELKDAFMTPHQIQYLVNEVMKLNSIDEERMEEARNRFLAMSQSSQGVAPSQKDGQPNTTSGVPAKG